MVTAAIVATQLTDHSTRAKRLTIGGVEFLQGNSFAIHRDSIDLTEAGPGGVSSLSFTIKDESVAATFGVDSLVEFWDITRNRPLFLGFIQNFSIHPTAVGRTIDVECIGIECLLDWMLVPNLTIPTGTWLATAIQMLVANATGVGFNIRAFTQPPGLEDYGSQQYPIAGGSLGFPLTQYDVVLDGASLRDACVEVITAANTWAGGSSGAYVTIDYYGGLRMFFGLPSSTTDIIVMSPPNDYDNMTIQDNVAGLGVTDSFAAGDLDFRVDAASVVRAVYITGGNFAGTGLVSDGTGIPGPVSYINDDTILTSAVRDSVAADYLGAFSQSVRATMSMRPARKTAIDLDNYRPGGLVLFVADTQVMATNTNFTVFSIHKSFPSADQEDWDVEFGGLAPSAVRQTRRLTRTTRS